MPPVKSSKAVVAEAEVVAEEVPVKKQQ